MQIGILLLHRKENSPPLLLLLVLLKKHNAIDGWKRSKIKQRNLPLFRVLNDHFDMHEQVFIHMFICIYRWAYCLSERESVGVCTNSAYCLNIIIIYFCLVHCKFYVPFHIHADWSKFSMQGFAQTFITSFSYAWAHKIHTPYSCTIQYTIHI